jgi:anti-sigma B factor antagonist
MRITERQIGNDVTLELQGRFTAPDDEDVLERAVDRLARAGWRRIVIDLSEVSLMDAGGLGALAAACRASLRNLTTLRLACVPKRIRKLIALARLTTVLRTFDSVKAALDDGSSGGAVPSSGSCTSEATRRFVTARRG